MKKFLIFLMLITSTNVFAEAIIYDYKDIVFKRNKAYYNKELINGTIEKLHKNGTVAAYIPYQNGLQNGVVQIFADDEILLYTYTVKNGILEGRLTNYLPGGDVSSYRDYRSNDAMGAAVMYGVPIGDTIGTIKINYKNGRAMSGTIENLSSNKVDQLSTNELAEYTKMFDSDEEVVLKYLKLK